MNNRDFLNRRLRRSRHAFTLIEVLVALGILAILLVIIVLPLRLAFDSFNAGNAQTLTQSALQGTLTDFEKDIRQAVYVFPNARVAGITNQAPYTDDPTDANPLGANNARLPYYLSTNPADTGEPGLGTAGNPNGIGCGAAKNWSNPSHLDMIQVRRDAQGDVQTPVAPSYNIVSYYARRQQLNKPYDPIDNPIVMYRAEYPAFGLAQVNGEAVPRPLKVATPTDALNASIALPRVNRAVGAATSSQCATSDIYNRSSLWLSHNFYGEADLLPLTGLGNPTDPDAATFDPAAGFATQGSTYSHTLAIPRGLALEATGAYRSAPGYMPVAPDTRGAEESLVPDTSFTCTDANNDGKIDRITISLGLASFDVGGEGQLDQNFQPKGTILRGTRTIDLPNIQ